MRSVHVQVDALVGGADDLVALLDDRRFDVVCAHGLLMYLRDVDTTAKPKRVCRCCQAACTAPELDAVAVTCGLVR
jgi:hypothetical protein